jgi:arginyl-tRNA synthetase
LRSLVIGDSLQRLHKWLGGAVVSDIHYGDWGLQMGLLLAYLDGVPLHEITIETLEEAYPKASEQAKSDEEFKLKAQKFTRFLQAGDAVLTSRWEHFVVISQQTVSRDLTALGITFDLYEGESDTRNIVEPMINEFVKAGLAVESDGALVIHTTKPMVLRKSDGASLYATTDLAALIDRINRFKPRDIIYVTDDRQKLHFEQVVESAKLIGWTENTQITHAYFGTVNGLDGKPLKTRDGGVPKLHDLIAEATEKAAEKNPAVAHEVAIAALKFADLQNLRTSSYVFDLDKFLSFEGKTGPYLLYQAVRIKSVLSKETASA